MMTAYNGMGKSVGRGRDAPIMREDDVIDDVPQFERGWFVAA